MKTVLNMFKKKQCYSNLFISNVIENINWNRIILNDKNSKNININIFRW